jgi:hypothetical protein
MVKRGLESSTDSISVVQRPSHRPALLTSCALQKRGHPKNGPVEHLGTVPHPPLHQRMRLLLLREVAERTDGQHRLNRIAEQPPVETASRDERRGFVE